VGQKSITFSGIDLRKPLTNPALIGKKEILDFRDTGELANDIKEAISNDEFEKKNWNSSNSKNITYNNFEIGSCQI